MIANPFLGDTPYAPLTHSLTHSLTELASAGLLAVALSAIASNAQAVVPPQQPMFLPPPLPTGDFFDPSSVANPLSPAQFHNLFPNEVLPTSIYQTPDIDNDTVGDVLVPLTVTTSTGALSGSLTVYSGWTGAELFTSQSPELNDLFAWSTGRVDDLNADGAAEVLIGAPGSDAVAADAGKAYLVSGVDGSILTTFTGAATNAAFGFTVAAAGDLDHDGLSDILISAPGVGAGDVYIFYSSSLIQPDGSIVAARTTADADLVLHGQADLDFFGFSLASAADADADGTDDIIIGAPANDGDTGLPADNPGRVYVYSGATGQLLADITGDAPNQFLGYSVSTAGDINNDGHADLFMGAPTTPDQSAGGRAFIFTTLAFGAGPTSRSCASADYILTPSVFNPTSNMDSLFGLYVSLGNDVTGDGEADLIVHAGFHDAAGNVAGTRGYVFSGADASFLYAFTSDSGTPPPPLTPDPNRTAVDLLGIVLGNFGMQNATAADGDLNGDGVVDSLDLIIAINNLNNGGAASQPPNPAGCDLPNCLGTISVDPNTGECLCNGQPTGVFSTGDGGGTNNNGAPWDPCADIIIPSPPVTEADCQIVAFCAAANAVKDEYNGLKAVKMAAQNDYTNTVNNAVNTFHGTTDGSVSPTSPRALNEDRRAYGIQSANSLHTTLTKLNDYAIGAGFAFTTALYFATTPAGGLIFEGAALVATGLAQRQIDAVYSSSVDDTNYNYTHDNSRVAFLSTLQTANLTLTSVCSDVNQMLNDLADRADMIFSEAYLACLQQIGINP